MFNEYSTKIQDYRINKNYEYFVELKKKATYRASLTIQISWFRNRLEFIDKVISKKKLES